MSKALPKVGNPLPETDHVLRYVSPRHVEDGVVSGTAFCARPGDPEPSVNWLEWFDPPIANQLAGVRAAARLTYAKTGWLALLNTGQTVRHVKENEPGGLVLSFVHDPLPANETHGEDPSHSLIKGVPAYNTPEAVLVGDLIANSVLAPLYPAVPQVVS